MTRAMVSFTRVRAAFRCSTLAFSFIESSAMDMQCDVQIANVLGGGAQTCNALTCMFQEP